MNSLRTKTIAVLVLTAGSVVAGLLPACIARRGRRQCPLFISALLCFGGGVLLATSLVHILPETREAMEPNTSYTELIFCAGFFLLYIIDELVHCFYGEEAESFSHNHHDHHHHHHNHHHQHGPYGTIETEPLVKPPAYNPHFSGCSEGAGDEIERPPSQLCHVGHQEPCVSVEPVASFGLLAALSVHAVLEGLVVGLETESTKVWLLLAAIASHKLVVSFCLGIELFSNRNSTSKRNVIYIFIFSVGSAVGIILGIFISDFPDKINQNVVPILQGLAGGTLLYVTVSEIIPRERARWHQRHEYKSAGILQFLSVGVGFVVMTLMTKFLDFHS